MKTILLVEDDDDIREIVGMVLEGAGYLVRMASNGQEGLLRLRELPKPDLVLVDLMMPIKTGYEYCCDHRADPECSQVPLIIMSADHAPTFENRSLKIDAFLKKPIDLQTLLDTVEALTNNLI